jgi:hypothetical protein
VLYSAKQTPCANTVEPFIRISIRDGADHELSIIRTTITYQLKCSHIIRSLFHVDHVSSTALAVTVPVAVLVVSEAAVVAVALIAVVVGLPLPLVSVVTAVVISSVLSAAAALSDDDCLQTGCVQVQYMYNNAW